MGRLGQTELSFEFGTGGPVRLPRKTCSSCSMNEPSAHRVGGRTLVELAEQFKVQPNQTGQ